MVAGDQPTVRVLAETYHWRPISTPKLAQLTTFDGLCLFYSSLILDQARLSYRIGMSVRIVRYVVDADGHSEVLILYRPYQKILCLM